MGSCFLTLNQLWMKSCGVFIERKLLILSPYVSNHAFKFQRNRPIREVWALSYAITDVKHILFAKFLCIAKSRVQNILSENKKIILKAYSTQKIGSGGNFERGKHVCDRRF